MGVAELGWAASWHCPQGAAVWVHSVTLIGLFIIKEPVGTLSSSTREPLLAHLHGRDSAQMQYLGVKRLLC